MTQSYETNERNWLIWFSFVSLLNHYVKVMTTPLFGNTQLYIARSIGVNKEVMSTLWILGPLGFLFGACFSSPIFKRYFVTARSKVSDRF